MKNALAFQWVSKSAKKFVIFRIQLYLYAMIAISICRRRFKHRVSHYSQIETVSSLLRLRYGIIKFRVNYPTLLPESVSE